MVTSFKHYNDVMDGRAAVRFLSFPRAGTGLWDYLKWVKTTEILIWCARNHLSQIKQRQEECLRLYLNVLLNWKIWAEAWDFQQFDILTSVDSDEPL